MAHFQTFLLLDPSVLKRNLKREQLFGQNKIQNAILDKDDKIETLLRSKNIPPELAVDQINREQTRINSMRQQLSNQTAAAPSSTTMIADTETAKERVPNAANIQQQNTTPNAVQQQTTPSVQAAAPSTDEPEHFEDASETITASTSTNAPTPASSSKTPPPTRASSTYDQLQEYVNKKFSTRSATQATDAIQKLKSIDPSKFSVNPDFSVNFEGKREPASDIRRLLFRYTSPSYSLSSKTPEPAIGMTKLMNALSGSGDYRIFEDS